MTSKQPAVSTGLTGQTATTRIASIDIFRGLTMAVMIFVNDLSSVHGLSKWTYHFPADVDAMSYVDMVFPFFLFAVGLSLPLAVQQRVRRQSSMLSLWGHIVLRSLALLVLGLVLANAQAGDGARMHLNPNLWALLALTGGMLLWAVYPRTWGWRRVRTLRSVGAVLLVAMAAMYRTTTTGGHAGWLAFEYPEILGLIGLTYFAVSLLYVPLRRFNSAPFVCLAMLLLLNVACAGHWITIDRLPLYVFPFGNGAMPAIAMAGVVVSTLYLGGDGSIPRPKRVGWALSLAVLCFALGWLLRPLGISKIRATPTWSVWSISAATVVFCLLYWICDQRKHVGWAVLLRPAGSNTLLTYLLPDLYFFLATWLGCTHLLGLWNAGAAGVMRSVSFTLMMLLLSWWLTRAKVRLQI